MTSLGTCRLVIPLSLSTIAKSGFSSMIFLMSARISFLFSSESSESLFSNEPNPLLASTPSLLKVSPYFSKRSAKYTFTAYPKIIGSLTFIMVAFRWIENKTFFSLASFICSSKNEIRAFLLKTVPSMISPLRTFRPSFRIFLSPFFLTNTILRLSSDFRVRDFSL